MIEKAACRAALFWPLVPSLLVFFPKSDLLLPVIATTSCWLWLDGWSVAAGDDACWRGWVSLAADADAGPGPDCAAAGSADLFRTLVSSRRVPRAHCHNGYHRCGVWLWPGWCCPWWPCTLWGNCNVTAIWIENLKNHAMFYDHNSRSFGLWLGSIPWRQRWRWGRHWRA